MNILIMKPSLSTITYGRALALLCLIFAFVHFGCTLIGFAIGASVDARQPKQEKNIRGWEVTTLKDNARITVYRKNGESLDGIYKGVVKIDPRKDSVATGLILEKKGSSSAQHHIPFDKIDHVYVPARKVKGRIIGPAIGFVIDAGVFLVVASNFVIDIGSAFGSLCPHVYSYDGKAYRLDAEMCSGAFYKAAQYSDRATLDHLRATDVGVYRIKIANEMQEADYVDRLSLLVFDHSEGSRIYATAGGRYIALSEPQAPCSAHTSKGTDITMVLGNNNEGTSWLSNPFGRNPDLRESVDLVFNKPAAASRAALLLALRNTPWAAVQHTEFLALQGRAFPEWYAGLNTYAGAGDDLKSALTRENALLVSVWDGAQWRSGEPVSMVGPAVDRSVVQELDLEGIPGETLRIRLDCPPGYWMINSVRVDFSYAEDIVPQELLPVKATDQAGQDVVSQLNRVDGTYFSMPAAGDYAGLEFACPPLPPDAERTVLIRCEGYYSPHILAEGESQIKLIDRLLHDPGAYNRWRLQNLNERRKPAVDGYLR